MAICATTACAEGPAPGGAGDADDADDARQLTESGNFARIHVRIWPAADALEPEPPLRTEARFVEYSGMSADEARARSNLATLAIRSFPLERCEPSDPGAQARPVEGGPGRSLELIDAGDLHIQIGSVERVVGLALVPDLLSWMHGVEYRDHDDFVPHPLIDPVGRATLALRLEGSAETEVPATTIHAVIPPYLSLLEAGPPLSASGPNERLRVTWQTAGARDERILLRVQAFEGAGPIGEEVSCVVRDRGRASLEYARLIDAGLSPSAESIRISASRFWAQEISLGAFEPLEAVVEVVDQIYVEPPSGGASHSG